MAEKYSDRLIKLGLTIAYYRKLRNLTQEKLAEKAKIGRGHLGHIEAANMFTGVSVKTLYAIADALEISITDLFDFK